MKRKIWWRGPEISVPMSDIKRMIEILKFPDRHNFEALDSGDDDALDAIGTVLAILEGHEAQAEATPEDMFKAAGLGLKAREIFDELIELHLKPLPFTGCSYSPGRSCSWLPPSSRCPYCRKALRNGDGPAVVDVQDPNLPYVGSKPGLSLVPCQNTLKVEDDE